jgi:hypothetical protein
MRPSLAAAIAALVILLSPVGTAPAQAVVVKSVGKPTAHKHYKLYVAKGKKHYHPVHTFKTAKAAHRAAHHYHKKGYRTKVRAA